MTGTSYIIISNNPFLKCLHMALYSIGLEVFILKTGVLPLEGKQGSHRTENLGSHWYLTNSEEIDVAGLARATLALLRS